MAKMNHDDIYYGICVELSEITIYFSKSAVWGVFKTLNN